MQDNTTNPAARTGPSEDELKRSREKIEALRDKQLPQMVDWFDPLLLVKVGIRTVLSKTIGDYADQRPMQAAHDDPIDEKDLWQRHDYRATRPNPHGVAPGQTPKKHLNFDADGALWVDFIADLGDGFEATYAMAYLMAESKLEIAGVSKEEAPDGLPGGELLILGGDLAYPDATIKEYNDRCVTPFNNAFQMKEHDTPKRKLYFIAGNHDWYDGLAAFTSVFCAARDRFSKGKGKKIGGWQCEQRRSYFALGLPYGWWVWGIDLALNVTIDDAQKDYFELMSEQTKPGEKIIIVLHAPLWQLNEDMTHLHEISELARNKGAEVVAVLAGDLHFYSRYHSQSEKLELQLITSGGGGAFAHPTHQEPLKLSVKWPLPKEGHALPHEASDYVDTAISVSAEKEYTADYTGAAAAPNNPITQGLDTSTLVKDAIQQMHSPRRPFDKAADHAFDAPAHFYPSRLKSRFLSLKNIWLPFHNRRLAIFLGVVYMFYAWVFQTTVVDPSIAIRNARTVAAAIDCRQDPATNNPPAVLAKCEADAKNAITQRIETILDPKAAQPGAAANGTGTVPGTGAAGGASTPAEQSNKEVERIFEHFLQSTNVAYKNSGAAGVATYWLKGFMFTFAPAFSTDRIMNAMLGNPLFFFMVFGLWYGLVSYVDIKSKIGLIKWPLKLGLGSLHFFSHFSLLLLTNALFDIPYQAFIQSGGIWVVVGVSLYTFLMLLVGGFLGGAVFGFYSATTSFFGAMHMDAFSAIGIKDYKNFLRMRFDKEGGLTIYAIGLDKVPGRKDWRAINPLTDAETYNDHNPIIVPKKAMKPHLIDKVVGAPTKDGWKW